MTARRVTMLATAAGACAVLTVIPRASLTAQQGSGADSLRLSALYRDAVRTDPRERELQLQERQTALRLRNIDADKLPALSGEGTAQYQSDVVTIPLRLPNGQPIASPQHDMYDAHLGVQQRLFDPSLGPRRRVERAQLAEAQARVRSSVYSVRQEVNEAFFSAISLQAQAQEIATTIMDLEARVREAAARVRNGAALPSDSATLWAALLQRVQQRDALYANRTAALTVLGELTGRPIGENAVLALPNVTDAVARVRRAMHDADSVRGRPEYERFARARDVLRAQEFVASSADKPRVSAFGRVGYGRPGLNALGDQFDSYWVGGVQVQWTPWRWGMTQREREVLALQRDIVASDETAFTNALRRSVERDLATFDQLAQTIVVDDQIVALRERIERETRARYDEGVITAAEYIDRKTDVVEARLARIAHQVERAQAGARVLMTLGVEMQ